MDTAVLDLQNGVLIPSPQQMAVDEFVRTGKGSATVEAVAGSGKTTTILMAAAKSMKGSVACVAYNKKIAVEMGDRLVKLGAPNSTKAMTLHSAGFSAWRRHASKVRVDEKKIARIMEDKKVPEVYQDFVGKLVSIAKQSGWVLDKHQPIGLLGPWEDAVAHFDLEDSLTEAEVVGEGIRYAIEVLEKSLTLDTEVIDFDDMILAPLYHGARFWQNDWVIIDEAQDTNATRRKLVRAMLKPNGRLLAVGDRHQAIYGFTGADSDALDLISQEFHCIQLPLTVSYRCPTKVVELAQTWVSHIEAAPGAPAGEVKLLDIGSFEKLPAGDLTKNDAVICRYTKPLVAQAYGFIRRGIPCHVEGRDIGRGLLAMTNKWVLKTCAGLREKLEEWTPVEVAKLMAKKQDSRAEALQDKVDTLFVIMDQLTLDATVGELRQAITNLFGDTEPGCASNLTLCTVHKSKGREWKKVYLLGREAYMPSKYAKQEWQKQQEINLMYVAITRAKQTLVEVVV